MVLERNTRYTRKALTSSSKSLSLGLTPSEMGMASPLAGGFTSAFSAAFLPPKMEGREGRVGSSGSLIPRKFAMPLPPLLPPACLASPSSTESESAALARCLKLSWERTSSSACSGRGLGRASGALPIGIFLALGSTW